MITWSYRFVCGDTGYNTLRAQGFPVPSIRTLQHRLKHLQFKPGVLIEVFDMMKLNVGSHPWCCNIVFFAVKFTSLSLQADNMRHKEWNCCFTLDECEISPSVEFDAGNRTILGASTFPDSSQQSTVALVFMLSGMLVLEMWGLI